MILAREQIDYQSWEAQTQVSENQTRKVVKRQATKSRRVYLVVVAMAFLLGILVAAQYTHLAVTGYQLDKQEKQLALLEKENQRLTKQVSELTSLNRIEKIATVKLGMVATQDVQFLAVTNQSDNSQATEPKRVTENQDNGFQELVKVLASIF